MFIPQSTRAASFKRVLGSPSQREETFQPGQQRGQYNYGSPCNETVQDHSHSDAVSIVLRRFGSLVAPKGRVSIAPSASEPVGDETRPHEPDGDQDGAVYEEHCTGVLWGCLTDCA